LKNFTTERGAGAILHPHLTNTRDERLTLRDPASVNKSINKAIILNFAGTSNSPLGKYSTDKEFRKCLQAWIVLQSGKYVHKEEQTTNTGTVSSFSIINISK
jgi:hypothetical protein